MSVGLSGLASGFDWHTLIDQLIQADRAPETRMRSDQSTMQRQNSIFGQIKTQLTTLQSKVQALSDPTMFDSRLAQSSDATIASATVSAGGSAGTYLFDFTQLATAAQQRGVANAGRALSSTDDVSGLTLSAAGFTTPITAGTFSINGTTVTVATSDTLQGVFDKISTATGGAVKGSYSASKDQINLSSDSEIVLGSATDTSNFLQAAKLYNNGSGTIQSTSNLGGVKLSGSIASANLDTAVVDDGTGSGSGSFTINGVSIAYNVRSDSVQDVLSRIGSSTAGVTASYDTTRNQFVLTNKATGDTGVNLEDVGGNFLAATGLIDGTLQHGRNLLYSLNGGDQLTSQSNTFTDAGSGLSVTALKKDSVAITVSSDTSKITTAINDFLTQYNATQSLIDTNTASTTDAQGKVTAGILTGDGDANDIASMLRSLSAGSFSKLSSTMRGLADLGIDSNGNDNTLALTDSTKLNDELSNNLDAVKQLFTNTSSGLAVGINNYITQTIGDSGVLATKQNSLTQQSADIDAQVSDLERRLTDEQQSLTNSFVNMETAEANINQQQAYLTKTFG